MLLCPGWVEQKKLSVINDAGALEEIYSVRIHRKLKPFFVRLESLPSHAWPQTQYPFASSHFLAKLNDTGRNLVSLAAQKNLTLVAFASLIQIPAVPVLSQCHVLVLATAAAVVVVVCAFQGNS